MSFDDTFNRFFPNFQRLTELHANILYSIISPELHEVFDYINFDQISDNEIDRYFKGNNSGFTCMRDRFFIYSTCKTQTFCHSKISTFSQTISGTEVLGSTLLETKIFP